MRLELVPIVLGALVALVGVSLLADAWIPDGAIIPVERRRRVRAPRSTRGELLVGAGVLLLAASLIGRDTWEYGTLAVIIGAVLVIVGAFLNRRYLRELFAFRGPLRRSHGGLPPTADRKEKRRIR